MANRLFPLSLKEFDDFIQSCRKETAVKFIANHIKLLDINIQAEGACQNFAFYDWPEEYKDLSNLDLREICFQNIDLSGVNFSHSNLSCATFIRCKLDSVDLSHTDLSFCSVKGTILTNIDLTEANIFRSHFDIPDSTFTSNFTSNIKYHTVCPETGSFIGYKIARLCSAKHPFFDLKNSCLVKLEIPEDAKRLSSYFGYRKKCRCDKAKVLEITSVSDPTVHYDIAYSEYSPNFEYKVGEMVSEDDFDDNKEIECSFGIHFFMTKEDALDYLIN